MWMTFGKQLSEQNKSSWIRIQLEPCQYLSNKKEQISLKNQWRKQFRTCLLLFEFCQFLERGIVEILAVNDLKVIFFFEFSLLQGLLIPCNIEIKYKEIGIRCEHLQWLQLIHSSLVMPVSWLFSFLIFLHCWLLPLLLFHPWLSTFRTFMMHILHWAVFHRTHPTCSAPYWKYSLEHLCASSLISHPVCSLLPSNSAMKINSWSLDLPIS